MPDMVFIFFYQQLLEIRFCTKGIVVALRAQNRPLSFFLKTNIFYQNKCFILQQIVNEKYVSLSRTTQ